MAINSSNDNLRLCFPSSNWTCFCKRQCKVLFWIEAVSRNTRSSSFVAKYPNIHKTPPTKNAIGAITIDPIADGDDEAEAGEEVAGEPVVAGRDAAEVLEAAEGALDDVAGFVGSAQC